MFFLFTFKNKEENFCGFKKKIADFQEFKFLKHIFKCLSIINLPCGHVMSHKKFGPDRYSRVDVYWMQTNKQTDNPNLYTDKFVLKNFIFDFLLRTECKKNASYSVEKKLEYPIQKLLAQGIMLHADQLVNNIIFQLLNE